MHRTGLRRCGGGGRGRPRSLLLPLLLTLAGCDVGIQPPEPAGMVSIDEGLSFPFGGGEPCFDADADVTREEGCSQSRDASFFDRVEELVTGPSATVELEPFAIDRHEVTNLQYEYCVALGECTPPTHLVGSEEHFRVDRWDHAPVVNVSREQARAYCECAGKRLPSEYEWERVAKGNPNDEDFPRRYPVQGLETLDDCRSEEMDLPVAYCRTDVDFTELADLLATLQPALDPDEPGSALDDDFVEEDGARIRHLFGNVTEWTRTAATSGSLPPTCESALPDGCQRCDQCDGDAACEQSCHDCAACDDDGTACHHACEGGSRAFPVCQRFTEPTTPDALQGEPGEAPSFVLRGGSAATRAGDTCRLRSTDRSLQLPKAPENFNHARGFRCACDLAEDGSGCVEPDEPAPCAERADATPWQEDDE